MRSFAALPILLAMTAAPVAAQDEAGAPDYLDDRSSPEQLVRSLYNAIERREYARAYGYFAQPPAADLESYAEGFDENAQIDIALGTAEAEGAAGSTYWRLPIAIRSAVPDAEPAVFAGCYQFRLAEPTIQSDPFQPLQIDGSSIAPSTEDLEAAVPENCADVVIEPPSAPASDEPAGDPFIAAAVEQTRTRFGEECDGLARDADEPLPVERWTIDVPRPTLNVDPQLEADAEPDPVLVQVTCALFAYNVSDLWYVGTSPETLEQVLFAEPVVEFEYSDEENAVVADRMITGWKASDRLINSDYDPETFEITSFEKGRGIGDVYSSGRWLWRNGEFLLVRYEVDGSFDGEINGETVYDRYGTP